MKQHHQSFQTDTTIPKTHPKSKPPHPKTTTPYKQENENEPNAKPINKSAKSRDRSHAKKRRSLLAKWLCTGRGADNNRAPSRSVKGSLADLIQFITRLLMQLVKDNLITISAAFDAAETGGRWWGDVHEVAEVVWFLFLGLLWGFDL